MNCPACNHPIESHQFERGDTCHGDDKHCGCYYSKYEAEKYAYELQIKKLMAALKDMFLLIEEHGSPTIRAHATRILRAKLVLSKLEEK
jgi:hypothetical protein